MLARHVEPTVLRDAPVVHDDMDVRVRSVGVQRRDIGPDVILMRTGV